MAARDGVLFDGDVVDVIMPDAVALGYIQPGLLNSLAVSNTYTYIITNLGYGTDRILKARILIPSGFTQVNNIQSSVILSDAVNAIILS